MFSVFLFFYYEATVSCEIRFHFSFSLNTQSYCQKAGSRADLSLWKLLRLPLLVMGHSLCYSTLVMGLIFSLYVTLSWVFYLLYTYLLILDKTLCVFDNFLTTFGFFLDFLLVRHCSCQIKCPFNSVSIYTRQICRTQETCVTGDCLRTVQYRTFASWFRKYISASAELQEHVSSQLLTSAPYWLRGLRVATGVELPDTSDLPERGLAPLLPYLCFLLDACLYYKYAKALISSSSPSI